MQVVIAGTVVADAPDSDLIHIEGNYYFPPSSLSTELFSEQFHSLHLPVEGCRAIPRRSSRWFHSSRRCVELSRPLPGLIRPGGT